MKRRRPDVPLFSDASLGGQAARRAAAEEVRCEKAGLPPGAAVVGSTMPRPTPRAPDVIGDTTGIPVVPAEPSRAAPSRAAPAAVAPSGVPTHAATPAASGPSPPATPASAPAPPQQKPPPPPGAPAAAAAAAAVAGRPRPPVLEAGGAPGAVYGFEDGRLAETKGKAIVLRLEPLKPGLPSFEKVLSESRQIITIGSGRGTADVLVREEGVSKKHVSLVLISIHGELGLAIVDSSTNGTFVNGKRLPAKQKRFRIRSGDTVLIKDPGLDDEFGWKLDFGNTVVFFARA